MHTLGYLLVECACFVETINNSTTQLNAMEAGSRQWIPDCMRDVHLPNLVELVAQNVQSPHKVALPLLFSEIFSRSVRSLFVAAPYGPGERVV